MPQILHRISKSKFAPWKTTTKEHFLQRILESCLIEIESNFLLAAARKVNITNSNFLDICNKAVKHAKDNSKKPTVLTNIPEAD